MSNPVARKQQRPREETVRRRKDILEAALATFGSKGYKAGSLADVAEQVGITQAGVLHYFGSKNQLLLDVLDYRDQSEVQALEGHRMPGGLDLFRHLVDTAKNNVDRPGIVQAYAVLSAESVTDEHPGREYFRYRYNALRRELAEALELVCASDDPPAASAIDDAAASVLAVMDGLQVQWLLEPERVDLARATAFAIEAILARAIDGHRRRVL